MHPEIRAVTSALFISLGDLPTPFGSDAQTKSNRDTRPENFSLCKSAVARYSHNARLGALGGRVPAQRRTKPDIYDIKTVRQLYGPLVLVIGPGWTLSARLLIVSDAGEIDRRCGLS